MESNAPKTSKAKLEGNKRHQAKLDRTAVYVPLGQLDKIREYAKTIITEEYPEGIPSFNAYVNYLIELDMESRGIKLNLQENL